jgi:predicted dehydrogenase
MDTLRFGLVGTGYWAETVHAAGLAAHAEVELVGIWGRDPAKATDLAGKLGTQAYADVDDLFDAVDVVAFAVPPTVQGELAVRAARAGKHLLLEKPIALDLASTDAIVEAVDAHGLSTVVFFTNRFVGVWESWLQEIILTAPMGGRADWMTRQVGADSPFASSPWRRQHGALWDVGPHMLSQLIPALGPIVEVGGVRGREDLVHLVLTHESGATSRMTLCQTMPERAVRIGVEFYGEQGWLIQPNHTWDLGTTYANAVSELLTAIRNGDTEHRCGIHFGREIVEVLARCEAVLSPR